MKIEEIKNELKEFKDFFGGELLDIESVASCSSKIELSEIIDRHSNHIEMMCNDALHSLERFRRKVGLSLIDIDLAILKEDEMEDLRND
ncbi:MAG: hypothetical protein V4608_14865 [Bacteroidota bacterium]